MPPSDDDILKQLDSIDPDELMGEEVSVDDALDFNLDEESEPNLAEESTADVEAVRAEAEPRAEAEATKPKKRKARRKTADSPVESLAAIEAGGRVIFVDEIVLHAKKLRIIAESVSIEPMDVTAPDAP